MRKYLLPLILILFIIFTLVGNCAWLSGYDQRIKLTIDNTKIDATPQYPTAYSDNYVKSTTKLNEECWAYKATNPSLSLVGVRRYLEWRSANTIVTNQRFHIDLGSAKIIIKIYYENSHSSGSDTDEGVQNFTFQGSNTGAGTFDDLVYANDGGWTTLTTSQSTFDEHVGANQADPKYITVTNTTAYRYYAFKFADNYGDAAAMSLRHVVLQTGISNFPVTIFFTSTQAEEIFTEFDADSDYMKCAFTSSDGTTQLYAEKELFDDSAQKAIYHVKVPLILPSADTDIYYYYDNDHADNTTYIGAINTTAGATVWDSNFKAVYHMVDATTSTVVDSTSNNNDGTKVGANEPVEAAGKVGQGQNFDGGNDKITVADSASLDIDSDITIEAIIDLDTYGEGTDPYYGRILAKNNNGNFDFWTQEVSGDNSLAYKASDGTGTISDLNMLSLSTWHHVAVSYDETTVAFYIDSVAEGGGANAGGLTADNDDIVVGTLGDYDRHFNGIIDELRVSDSIRNAAWLKATYNTLYDSLLTYGSEETSGVTYNAIIFGTNF